MKTALVTTLGAALAVSVAGFLPSSSVVPVSRGSSVSSDKIFGASKLSAANRDVDMEVFLNDMLRASSFVYQFRNLRFALRENGITVGDGKRDIEPVDQKAESLLSRLFSRRKISKKKIKFYRPELIITDKGAQETDENKYLKYVITPNAIKEFLENNRKYFKQEKGGFVEFDETQDEKNQPFEVEAGLNEQLKDNVKIIDFDDAFTIQKSPGLVNDSGGLVYGLVINLTKKWVCVVFRGTAGLTDIGTDRNFSLDDQFFFNTQYGSSATGGNPSTHAGFTSYLSKMRENDAVERPFIDRIMAAVDDVFENHPDVAGKDFNLYVTGHSLGGALANLFAFHTARLKENGSASVTHLPEQVTAMTFAAPVVGDGDFNKKYQYLEEKGVLRHIRISNEGDLIPTNSFIFPVSLIVGTDAKEYTQNGVNIFLREKKKASVSYGNTKGLFKQLLRANLNPMKALDNHMFPEYQRRLLLKENKILFEQTVEDIYNAAGDFTQ